MTLPALSPEHNELAQKYGTKFLEDMVASKTLYNI